MLQCIIFIPQLQEVASNMSMTSLNYTQYLTNAQTLAERYQTYFSGTTLPSLPEFMMYRGNYTEWLTRIENAFLNPGTTDADTLKL